MSSIQTGIELNDNFTGILNNVIGSVNLAILAMENMQGTMHADIDTSELEGARAEIDRVTMAVNEMEQAMSELAAPAVNTPRETRPNVGANSPPESVNVPVSWQTNSLDVFTNSGIERFRQEVQSADTMLQQLSTTQDTIARRAFDTMIFPPEAFQNLNSMAVRIDNIRERIQQIENNPLNVGTNTANSELEHLRMQLNQMIVEQNELNAAMDNMDVSAANEAYLRLNQTVSGTEKYLRDNVDRQGRWNREIQEGSQQANGLVSIIRNAVMAYASIQSVKKVLSISDELAQTTSRLDLMNDGVQSTQELVNMVYAAAQDSRGSFAEMADVVARFGNNAKDAFSSSAEVVAFADLVQKQMTIAGASTQESSNAMLQLSQALGSGVLRGDELNSIFEQAPNLIQSIADYLDVPIGQIREMASEGQLSADVVKAAIFASADEINAKFNEMPMTWGQVWQSMQNTALIAFQPVLQRLSNIANSEAFQTFVDGAIEAMAALANILLNVFDMLAAVGGFAADNWSIISPIIYGVIAALAVYYGWQLLSAAANGIMMIAQKGLNAAMYACPLVWIIMLIIALIAVIFAVCSAIAKMTGVAGSGFGVICGSINVANEFFKNLFMTIGNVLLGIGNAIAALASNMMTAFHNAICSVQSWFYNLLSTALLVIEGICVALNKLPFVEFDYSGISNAADDYAAKAAEAAGNKEEYKSIGDAFNEGFSTFDAFQDGWASDAFNAGAAWGDGIAEKVSNFSLADLFPADQIPSIEDYVSDFGDSIAGNIGDIAGNTDSIKDSLDCTEEDLKYLRDIAEQDAVNRFTTAEIKVEQTNHNNISSSMDLDGVVSGLTDAVNEAVDSITEGVHE